VARGRRVALIDLDPQSNVAAMLSGDPVAPGTVELLARHAVEPQVLHGIQVYAGGPSLDDPGLVMRLDPNDLAIALAKLPVDVVICDCPPGHQHLERLALRAGQISLVPFEPHPVAVIGVQRVLETIAADRELGRPAPSGWRFADRQRLGEGRIPAHGQHRPAPEIQHLVGIAMQAPLPRIEARDHHRHPVAARWTISST
jgi:cellulose biosynthesis protein BcsQ